MKTIELNEQQVELLKICLNDCIDGDDLVSHTYRATASQILMKLDEE